MHLDNETIALDSAISRAELEELFATKALLANPEILDNVCVFEKIVFALNGLVPSFEVINVPNTLMIAGAVHKLGPHTYSEDVKKYMACIMYEDGFVIAPSNLSFVQKYLDRINCKDCREDFKDHTAESLMQLEPWDDLDVVSNAVLKLKTVEHYLSVLNA